MDRIVFRQTIGQYVKKYRFAFLILAAGLFLMSFPQEKAAPEMGTEPIAVETETLEHRLGVILGQIDGVGKTRVLLTEISGVESVYQTDGILGTDGRTETVIITDGGRKESGLVRQVIAPVYQGAIVVCQGGGNASIRLVVMQAVSNVTGIPVSRITVLKMN